MVGIHNLLTEEGHEQFKGLLREKLAGHEQALEYWLKNYQYVQDAPSKFYLLVIRLPYNLAKEIQKEVGGMYIQINDRVKRTICICTTDTMEFFTNRALSYYERRRINKKKKKKED